MVVVICCSHSAPGLADSQFHKHNMGTCATETEEDNACLECFHPPCSI